MSGIVCENVNTMFAPCPSVEGNARAGRAGSKAVLGINTFPEPETLFCLPGVHSLA